MIFAYLLNSITTETSGYEKGGLQGNTLDKHSRLGTSCLRQFSCLPMSYVARVSGRNKSVRHRCSKWNPCNKSLWLCNPEAASEASEPGIEDTCKGVFE